MEQRLGWSMKGGTNLSRVGDYNRQLVLETIRLKRVSRVEIARETGLTAQTITNIVRKLMDEGLVVEADDVGLEPGKYERGVGKPRVGLQLRAGARCALGMHIDRHESHIALLDLSGAIIDHEVCRTELDAGPQGAVEQLTVGAQDLVRRSGVDPNSIVGLGVASPGPLDPETGEVLGPLGMIGWDRVPLKTMLEERMGLQTEIENDAVASAVGERWAGAARGARNFMFVYMGWGIGAGLFIDGQIYRGSSGTAGEIAHLPVDPHGVECWCGKKGCLTRLCASSTVVEAVIRRRPSELTSAISSAPLILESLQVEDEKFTYTDAELNKAFSTVCELASGGDSIATDELNKVGAILGTSLAGLVDLLDLELIIMGGSAFDRARDFYLPTVGQCIRDTTIWPNRREIRIEGSAIGDQVAAVGAASAVLHKYFAPQVTGLELSVG